MQFESMLIVGPG